MVKAALHSILAIAAVNLAVVKPLSPSADAGMARSSIIQTHLSSATDTNFSNEPIQPIPLEMDIDVRKVELGKRLFTDRQLHINRTRSCADCHDIRQGGANTRRVADTLGNMEMRRNTPTIFNVSFNKSYYWSASFTSLEQQLDDAIKELGLTWHQLIEKLQRTPQYVALFDAVFPASGITISNIKQAIIAYEHSLITPNSRFDRYLRGDLQALNNNERKGYELFKSYGCSACHQGINAGGNVAIDKTDLYRKAPGKESRNVASGNIPRKQNRLSLSHRGNRKIRVPSLRNVALTAPYFQDGSADTLEQAVGHMSDTVVNPQLGIRIPPHDIKLIVAFLRTLTGEYNGKTL
jgi:cytochrome c peroxidase